MRWLVLVLLAIALATGCDLNPQPEVPGSDEPEGPGGAAGAGGEDLEGPVQTDDDPGRSVDPAPNDYSAGAGNQKSPRPDGGTEREALDAGPEAAPPPVVAM